MTVQNEYGRALFLLAKDEGTMDDVNRDIALAHEILTNNPDYARLLDTPAVSKSEKLALAADAFASLHYCVRNLIMLLSERHSVYTFRDVAKTYSAMYDEEMGIERVDAVTALPMTEEQIMEMKRKLDALTGKQTVIRNIVEPEILGGVKIRYAGQQIDGSLKTRLDSFSESIKNIII